MKPRGRWLIVVSALVLAGIQAAVAARLAISAAGKISLSQFLTAAVDRGDVPGIVALVVDREGVLYEGAFGKLDVARGTAMPTDAVFRIASMTKPITAVAIMMLVDAGKLSLDDPVGKYLPEFADRQVITTFNAGDATYQT